MFWFISNSEVLVAGAVIVVFAMLALPRRAARVCRRCREINREEAYFCAQCGTRLKNQ